MAQALADRIGGTKRQVQFWTDHGVLQCLGTRYPGTGRQRKYEQTEIPIGRVIVELAEFQMPVGRLLIAASFLRRFSSHELLGSSLVMLPSGHFLLQEQIGEETTHLRLPICSN